MRVQSGEWVNDEWPQAPPISHRQFSLSRLSPFDRSAFRQSYCILMLPREPHLLKLFSTLSKTERTPSTFTRIMMMTVEGLRRPMHEGIGPSELMSLDGPDCCRKVEAVCVYSN